MDSEAPTRKLDGDGEPVDELAAETSSGGVVRRSGELRRGARLSRYVLIDRLGAGGMGVVYRAYDPELDRQVALKVLHESDTGSTESARRDRLLREAQVLAKLSHPNIVKVHDVGLVDGRIFIAMDLIEGTTLKHWIRARPRDWRETVAVFCQAGRGLAAAHAADIIHRDFKPENVLLGDDGGVYVLDFGLARTPKSRRRPDANDAASRLRRAEISNTSDRLIAALTETGTVLGTPAYMAPEQHAGGRVDGRADQFGFCVALYEALYGVRPFAGGTVDELVSSVMRHQLRAPSRERRVPAALRRIVERGLSLDPGDRFPTIKALLRRLEGLPDRARRRFRLGAVGLGLALASAGSYTYIEHRRATVCSDGDIAGDAVWNESREQEIRRSFAGISRPYAAVAANNVSAALDDYTRRWRAQWRQACEATRVHGEQSAERFSRREQCLWRGLLQVEALTRELSGSDVDVVDNAIQATQRLPALSRCEDPGRRSGSTTDDGLALGRQLATATALRDVGRLAAAATLADELLAGTKGSTGGDLVAEARLIQAEGHLARGEHDLAESSYYEAIWSADAVGADHLSAAAWVGLFGLVSKVPTRDDEAQRLAADAQAAIRRAGTDLRLEATLATHRGEHERRRAHLDGAIRHHQRAFELRTEALGSTHLDVAASLSALGAVHRSQGKLEQAVADQFRALAIAEDALGPDHPAAAPFMASLGDALMAQGKHTEARIHSDRARAILTDAGQR